MNYFVCISYLLLFGQVCLSQEKSKDYIIVDSLIATNKPFDSFKAIQLLENDLISDTIKSTYWLRKSVAAYNRSQYELSRKCIEKAIVIDPNNSQAHYELAKIMNASFDFKSAINEITLALALSSNDKGEYYFWRGVFNQNDTDFKSAIEDYNMAIDNKFENADLYNNLAIAYSSEGLYSDGLKAINKALELNPDYLAAISARAKLHFFLLNIDESCSDSKRAKELGFLKSFVLPDEICDCQDPNLQIQYATELLANGKYYKQAIEGFTTLINNGFENKNIYLNLGYCHYQLYEYELAEKYYFKALEIQTTEEDLLYENIALLYYDWGKFDRSIEFSTIRIKLDPENHRAYLERGGAYREMKQYNLAERDFNKSLELEPDFFRAFAYRAFLNLEQKKYDIALIDAQESVRINPEYGFGHRVLGLIKMELGESDFCQDFYTADRFGDPSAKEVIEMYCE